MSRDEDGTELADAVHNAVSDNTWLERVTQMGWVAKSVVYTLMGLTALQIARQDPTEDNASPEGSIGRVAEAPLGRALLVVLTVGLVLYVSWRVLSVAVIRGHGVSEWADRFGYSLSAIFYLVLAFSAGKAAISGIEPEDSNSVESISTTLLDITTGRWLLGIGGIVTMVVGVYFAVHKGLQRSFAADLYGVDASFSANETKRKALLISGIIGWVGRGVVTIMVGFFVLRSAYRFDSNDARGFDRALRQVAGTSTGSTLVFLCAVGLLAYGVFCFFSHRFRRLEES